MEIRCIKETRIINIFGIVFILLYLLVTILQRMYPVTIIVTITMGYYLSCNWIMDERIIGINEKGITIRFMKKIEHYCWSQLQVKEVHTVKTRMPHHKWPYKEAVIFSIKPIGKFIRRHPVTYNLLCHPYSFVIIYLKEQDNIEIRPWEYVADELIFRENIKKWGVEIVNAGRHMYV